MYNNDDAFHDPGSQGIHKLLGQPDGMEAENVLNESKEVRQYACQNFRGELRCPVQNISHGCENLRFEGLQIGSSPLDLLVQVISKPVYG